MNKNRAYPIFTISMLTFVILSSAFGLGWVFATAPNLWLQGGFFLLFFLLLIAILLGCIIYFQKQHRRLEDLREKIESLITHPDQYLISGTLPIELQSIYQTVQEISSQLQREKEDHHRMVADVSHELRTPLAIVRGQLENLLQEDIPLAFQQSILPVYDETLRMTQLIQDLQALSLAEGNRLRLEKSWFPISSLLKEVIEVFQWEAESHEITITLECDTEQEVYWDIARMKQVLINLLGNAVQYSEGGSVIVSVQLLPTGKMQVEVSDTGKGIPPEKIPYLFQRFYRGEKSRNRVSGGTGLGLAIAKEFIELHGGQMDVSSEIGVGTKFKFEVPVLSE
ncbi:sensor histidine kinase [Risungbinella massiliensis]|uniref:sensor histidine kinase n=1 Tax=Risungbinella massiliensis TaxID=1329796 RepID=UPI0006999448|nr:HAMP domain-containing sensor histidine kinase [Risungbinella massiliensis]